MTVLYSTEPAATRWNDWVGTVAADDPVALAGTKIISELTSLDSDHWIIVGLRIA